MAARIGIVLAALAIAGCAGDSASISTSALPRLVLQPSDVPAGLERFDEGRQARADQPGGARAALDRFGRLGGWKSRYRSRSAGGAAGVLVVESRTDVFESAGGASDELEAFEGEPQGELTRVELGDEAFMTTVTQPGFPKPLRVYVVAWRHDNAVAVVTVNGVEGQVTRAGCVGSRTQAAGANRERRELTGSPVGARASVL